MLNIILLERELPLNFDKLREFAENIKHIGYYHYQKSYRVYNTKKL